ncbi:hypothetical protein [Mesorhizobium sp. M0816]
MSSIPMQMRRPVFPSPLVGEGKTWRAFATLFLSILFLILRALAG